MFKLNEHIRTRMSLEILKQRLEYYGGNQEQRMIKDKVRGLKKALLYSYQAATAILSDNREFRCLINPDKDKPDYDNKIISIPFEDICLNKRRVGTTTEGQEKIGIKPGDVFTWKENNTHWLVFLRYLTEKAYFMSEIRRCDTQVNINGQKYWVYVRGPVETSIIWNQKKGIVWNDLNYSTILYITADENTNSHFQRFAHVKILDPRDGQEKTWQVAGVDPHYGDGIIQVFVNEYFENKIAEAAKQEAAASENDNDNPIDETAAYIDGPKQIKTYSMNTYIIKNISGGKWLINWFGKEIDLHCSSDTLILENPSKQTGKSILIYRIQGQEDITLNINIVSL